MHIKKESVQCVDQKFMIQKAIANQVFNDHRFGHGIDFEFFIFFHQLIL